MLVYTGMLALLATGLGVAYHSFLVRQLDADATAELEDVTRGLHGYLQFKDGAPVLAYNKNDSEAVTFIEEATRFYQIYDARSGRLLVQSPALERLGLDYTPGEIAGFRQDPRVQDVQTDRGRFRIQSSLISPTRGETYLLQVAEPLDRVDRVIDAAEQRLVWGIFAGLIVAAVVGQWMSGRALAPLSQLATATRAISISNLQHRLPVRGGGDELDEVSHAFNQALDRLDHAVGEMRQFSAALAHELRTPLAVLRGETELALTQSTSPAELRTRLAVQLDEFDKLARLINQLLTLARAEAGEIVLAREAVELGPLCTTVTEQLEAVAEARGVRLGCSLSSPVTVVGDAGWLERLLLILLDNAIKFTSAGGLVDVRVSREQAHARLDVRDTGPGIAADAVPHLFEPFYRVDPSRSRQTDGAGLGLALAKWIVAHHDGTIGVTGPLGHGSTFTVRLPVAPHVHS